MTFDRRQLLQLGALGLSSGIARIRPSAEAPASLPAATLDSEAQLLIIFLRGANDGVQTLIPALDPDYSLARANMRFLPHELTTQYPGTFFSRLHPEFTRLMSSSSPIQANQLALMHQTGNPSGKRSHFTEQQIYETAKPGAVSELDPFGFAARMIATGKATGAGNWADSIPAISIAPRPQRLFATDNPEAFSAHTTSLKKYGLKHLATGTKLELAQSSSFVSVLRNHFASFATSTSPGSIGNLVAESGEYFLDTDPEIERIITNPTAPLDHDSQIFGFGPTAPNSAAEDSSLPFQAGGNGFLSSVEEAVFFLNQRPGCRVAGIDFGGFDTHGKQRPTQDNLLAYLTKALGAIWKTANKNVLTLVISEFGRTARENSGPGTDHGVGGVTIAMNAQAGPGPSTVVGGTYNCHNGTNGTNEHGATWRNLLATPSSPAFENAVEVKTDFRAIYAEILHKHFGFDAAQIGQILPNYSYDINGTGPDPRQHPLAFLS